MASPPGRGGWSTGQRRQYHTDMPHNTPLWNERIEDLNSAIPAAWDDRLRNPKGWSKGDAEEAERGMAILPWTYSAPALSRRGAKSMPFEQSDRAACSFVLALGHHAHLLGSLIAPVLLLPTLTGEQHMNWQNGLLKPWKPLWPLRKPIDLQLLRCPLLILSWRTKMPRSPGKHVVDTLQTVRISHTCQVILTKQLCVMTVTPRNSVRTSICIT